MIPQPKRMHNAQTLLSHLCQKPLSRAQGGSGLQNCTVQASTLSHGLQATPTLATLVNYLQRYSVHVLSSKAAKTPHPGSGPPQGRLIKLAELLMLLADQALDPQENVVRCTMYRRIWAWLLYLVGAFWKPKSRM